SCEHPYINNEGEILGDISVYYSKNCLKTQKNQKWVNILNSKEDNLNPSEYSASPFVNSMTFKDKPFYREKWFLVAAGIVGTALIISAVRNSNKDQPTHETVSGF